MKNNNTIFYAACILAVAFVGALGFLIFSNVKTIEVDPTVELASPAGPSAPSSGEVQAETEASSIDAEAKAAASGSESIAVSGSESAAAGAAGSRAEAAASGSESAAAGAAASSAEAAEATVESDAESDAESGAESGAASASDQKKKKHKKKKDADSSAEPALSPEEQKAAEQAALLASTVNNPAFWEGCPERDVELLTPNPYSRCGEPLTAVNTLVIHYVGNAGTTAMDNQRYFESLKDSGAASASSHFIIGLDGEIVQCVPLSEISYASNDRNRDTISIECCHPEPDGRFSDATYASLVELCAFLCKSFEINPQELIRHYDITGKLCPLYYVENPDEWQELKDRIEARTDEMIAAESGSSAESAD